MNWHNLNFNVQRSSRRKTMNIIVERDGSLVVQAPKSMTDSEVAAILDKREYAVFRNIADWKVANQERIFHRFLPGQTFLFLGRSYPLEFCARQRKHLLLTDNSFSLRESVAEPRRAFVKFYKKQAKTIIPEQVTFFEKYFSRKPIAVRIREMPARWGSCTPTGNLYFNWRCIMLPPGIIDYLIVHELAHLEELNHSAAFWQKVAVVLPDYERRRDWLRRHGVQADF
ncbi:MAG: M48 family metallopeptidase [Thermoguttaceae bacterium]|nr:M48 family metallopeptidase [Thermoguttaceae bacterium]